MGSSKFMVIKFKDLLKTAIFAVLGVVIIIAIVYFIVPKNNQAAKYMPGVYTSSITVDKQIINVDVAVDKNNIKSISLVHTSEITPVFYPIFEQTAETIVKEIISKQSLDITIPAESAVTSQLIIDAVSQSLNQASAE